MDSRIAIVGAGFSGAVVAANLLRRPPAVVSEIVLIERSADMCRGAAYAAHAFPYLLNVPAGRLSADSSEPLQFLEFARRTLPAATAEDFLPRRLYGDYLQDFLAAAERAAGSGIRLTRVCGEATTLSRGPDGALVVGFAGREPIAARRVILALGNPPPATLPWAEAIRQHSAYRDNPFDLPTDLRSDSVVLVVGNGLTRVDVVYCLTHDAARAPRVVTISRRGLIPLTQSEFHVAAVQGGGELVQQARTVRELVSATRTLAREVEQHGGDWREAVTFIRNHASVIWQRLSDTEKRRFVRHVQCYWDVHRHRLPAGLAAHVDALRLTGRLEIRAGRIDRVAPEGRRLRVTWRNRGVGCEESLSVDAVINATGPDFALRRSPNPLLKSLRSAGMICEDSLGLGLATTPQHACVARDGTASDSLFYLGPMLRATHWETTAATELRNHAEQLARHLCELGARSSG
jgi:uncharacterized NAD(P)/FAD-binding protein YdhS